MAKRKGSRPHWLVPPRRILVPVVPLVSGAKSLRRPEGCVLSLGPALGMNNHLSICDDLTGENNTCFQVNVFDHYLGLIHSFIPQKFMECNPTPGIPLCQTAA